MPDKNDEKINRYINLISDFNGLKNASKSIIRKKRSALARKIEKGKYSAILKAANDVFYGSQSKEQREKICALICKAIKQLTSKVTKKTWREILALLLGAILSEFNIVGGLIFSLLWILREKLYKYICPNHPMTTIV